MKSMLKSMITLLIKLDNVNQRRMWETVLTRFIVVINQHHGITDPRHFVVSDDGKSDANLSLVELQWEMIIVIENLLQEF